MMGSFLHYSDDNNATFQALKEYYEEEDSYTVIGKISFPPRESGVQFLLRGAEHLLSERRNVC